MDPDLQFSLKKWRGGGGQRKCDNYSECDGFTTHPETEDSNLVVISGLTLCLTALHFPA